MASKDYQLSKQNNRLLECLKSKKRSAEKLIELRRCLEQRADVNTTDHNGITPLHLAARYDKAIILKLLLKRGAKVDARDVNAKTPLHEATSYGRISATKVLLNHGADINAKTSDEKTPLHVAAASNATSVVKLLLSNEADIDAQDKYGNTPLYESSRDKKIPITKLLLSHGANIHLGTSFGFTPLHGAAMSKDPSITKLLLENGADVDAKENNGTTPLYWAALSGAASVAEILLHNGANVNAKPIYSCLPLYAAVSSGNPSVVKLLLNHGADVNEQLIYDETALHQAVRSQNISIVELLLNRSANVNAQKNDGETPLHIAVRHEHVDIANLLVRRGADVTLRNEAGETSFTYAMFFAKGNKELLSLLRTAEKKANTNVLLDTNQSPTLQTIFQIDEQNIISNNSLKIDQFKYSKTADTSGLPGQLYETKMLSLVFIRMLNHEQIEHDMFLGSNIDGIGAMDDICLRYRVRGQQRPVVLFLQAKHREDPEKGKISDEALWSDSSDFSLQKYFESYITIRERFRVNNVDPLFEAEFSDVDCYFILYTPTKENLSKKNTANKISETVDNLINTSKSNVPFQYNYDDADIARLFNLVSGDQANPRKYDKDLIKDFFNTLWFFSYQAKEDVVEQKVKDDINTYYNNEINSNHYKFELHSKAIFLIAHNEIQKWWMQRDMTCYLTRSNDFFQFAKQSCLDNVFLILFNVLDNFKVTLDVELVWILVLTDKGRK